MKKVVVIDNYDSFTYNLVQIIEKIIGHEVTVIKNDEFIVDQIEAFDYIIISPGPGLPEASGYLLELIQHYYKTKKILGICLGLQAIAKVLGGKLKQLNQVYHGIETKVFYTENNNPIFNEIEDGFSAGRYHSWVVDPSYLPSELIQDAIDDDNEIMSLRHRSYPVFGVQFHPESIMTPVGEKILTNFLNL